jgi:hypothetical protein
MLSKGVYSKLFVPLCALTIMELLVSEGEGFDIFSHKKFFVNYYLKKIIKNGRCFSVSSAVYVHFLCFWGMLQKGRVIKGDCYQRE